MEKKLHKKSPQMTSFKIIITVVVAVLENNYILNMYNNLFYHTLSFQSGLCSSSQLETSRGSIRIHHLTGSMGGGLAPGSQPNKDQSRFPRLEDCAHFHYEITEIGPIKVKESPVLFNVNFNSRTKN